MDDCYTEIFLEATVTNFDYIIVTDFNNTILPIKLFEGGIFLDMKLDNIYTSRIFTSDNLEDYHTSVILSIIK
ncbi:MAG: hypothetical protein FWF57_09510 [Defluviitaleaceae bacterium]|nr:hypothetical protein [Defluviitaleaceae bacterium]